jgi:alkylated DNA repair protein alkB homolog 6
MPGSPAEMVSSSSSDVFTGPSSNGGRAIDPTPVLSLLLEPRSVIITSGALYKEHLHCIEEVKEDWVIGAAPEELNSHENETVDGVESQTGSVSASQKRYRVDNWEAIEEEAVKKLVREGGMLERGTRVSLTCRDVEKTRKVGLPGFGQR